MTGWAGNKGHKQGLSKVELNDRLTYYNKDGLTSGLNINFEIEETLVLLFRKASNARESTIGK